MKLPQINLRDLISVRFTRRQFGGLKFFSLQSRSNCGELKLPQQAAGTALAVQFKFKMSSLRAAAHKIGQHDRTVKSLLQQLSKPQKLAACGASARCAF